MSLEGALPDRITRIVAAVRDRLAGMTMDEADPRDPARRRYAYSPASVAVVDGFQADLLREKIGTQFFITVGENTESTKVSRQVTGEVELWLLLARPSTRPTNPHAQPTPIPAETAAMLADAKNRLHEDPRLGGLVHSMATPVADHNVDVELGGRVWAVAMLYLRLEFQYPRGQA